MFAADLQALIMKVRAERRSKGIIYEETGTSSISRMNLLQEGKIYASCPFISSYCILSIVAQPRHVDSSFPPASRVNNGISNYLLFPADQLSKENTG